MLPIKFFALNNFLHGLSYQVPDRLMLRNSTPYLRGRNVDPPTDQLISMRGLFACAVENNEANQFLQLIEAMPLMQLFNVVFTDQAVEGRVAFAPANFFNSIDCVRRRRTQQLAFIHFELRLASYGRPQHC